MGATRFGWVGGVVLAATAGLMLLNGCSPTAPQRRVEPRVAPLPAGTPVFVPAPAGPAPSGRAEEGHFTLTVDLGPLLGAACDAVPAAARTRHYASTVSFLPFRGLQVDLGDATFLNGPACGGSEPCNRVRFSFDDFVSGYIWLAFLEQGAIVVEQLGSGSWLQLSGWPYGRLATDVTVLSGPMELQFWSGDPVGSSYALCRAPSATVTMTRWPPD